MTIKQLEEKKAYYLRLHEMAMAQMHAEEIAAARMLGAIAVVNDMIAELSREENENPPVDSMPESLKVPVAHSHAHD